MEFLDQLLQFIRNCQPMLKSWLADGGNLPTFCSVMFLVVFAETGLVVTPFLPGDSLLFALGTLCVGASASLNLPLLFVLLGIAAVLGDAVNYHVGHYLGPKVFRY